MSDYSYSPSPQPPADRSVKVPHLVFGLLFVGIAGIWALGTSEVISGEHLAVLGPAVLILAGIAGLAASLASGRNRRRAAALPSSYDETPTEPTTEPTTGEPTEEIR